MTITEAIIVLEDRAARFEMSSRFIPAKTKAGRLAQQTRVEYLREFVHTLKELEQKEFNPLTPEYIAKYGDYWKLRD